MKSVLKTKASHSLEEEVKKELQIPDPIVTKAKAIIEENEKDGDN